MRSVAAAVLALAAGSSALAADRFDPNYMPASYYGDNDLKDYYQAGRIMRRFSESTAALFAPGAIPLDEATGNYTLKKLDLKGKFNLREGEAFGSQPVGAYCTGVLVGPDLLLTAGHCFKPDPRGGPCDKVRIVFGYAVASAGSVPASFPPENVYACKQIVAQKVMDDEHNLVCRNGSCTEGTPAGLGADYALVRLDRTVAGRPPLAISRVPIAPGTAVGAIGHPSGLPVKIQETGASVRTVTRRGYFVTDLDTFRGNSGSPVFNLSTFKIEGILSRGGVDYVYSPASSGPEVEDPRNPYLYSPGRANIYGQQEGRGEDVTFMSEIQSLIPRSEMETYLDDTARQREQPRTAPSAPRTVPAIYMPGQNGFQAQPAVYTVPEPSAPEPISI